MLQQILKDMFIDPELLEELSDEQKQILFMKMREEQVRRYDGWVNDEVPAPGKKTNDKGRVDFLMDAQNEPWTWVFGETDDELPYDELVKRALQAEEEDQRRKDEEDAHKAKELAKKQAEEKVQTAHKEREARRQRLLSEEEDRMRKEHEAFEAELRRKEAEMIYATAKEARLAGEKAEEEKERKKKEQADRLKKRTLEQEEMDRREEQLERERLQQEAAKREEEIYVNMRTLRIQQEATEKERMEVEWRKQEERAKAYEKERRQSMLRAKEVHKTQRSDGSNMNTDMLQRMRELSRGAASTPENVRKSSSGNTPPAPRQPRPNISQTGTLPTRPSVPRPVVAPTGSLPRQTKRAARPANKAEVILWFKDVEWPRRIVCNKAGKICPWFHGILSRGHAEQLLDGKPAGTFLIRVSERIWGYTVSVSSAHRCKHFLVDAAVIGKYQFFGDNQKVHDDLHSLIEFHQKYPISVAGQELLMTPQDQIGRVPDYQELMS